MKEQIVIGVLGALTALFGGLNVFQLLFLRSTHKRYRAEANMVDTDAREKEIHLMQSQCDYVMKKLGEVQSDFFSLSDRYLKDMVRFSEEMVKMSNEITRLRSQIYTLTTENKTLVAENKALLSQLKATRGAGGGAKAGEADEGAAGQGEVVSVGLNQA